MKNKCKFCPKEINNRGSLKVHERCCKYNPNRIQTVSSNKGKILVDQLQKSLKLVETREYLKFCETVIRRHVRKYLLHTIGNKCSICGLSEWLGQKISLVCDHIDGNSENNELSNFRLICHNCDALLPTYKSKNKGNGRKYDRDYRRRKVLENSKEE